jgi:hypothetical protein
MREKVVLRLVARATAIGAFAWGAEVVRQALQSDDGGPPAGAIGAAMPAFALLIGAGFIGSSTGCR